jgi:hypothetical protein
MKTIRIWIVLDLAIFLVIDISTINPSSFANNGTNRHQTDIEDVLVLMRSCRNGWSESTNQHRICRRRDLRRDHLPMQLIEFEEICILSELISHSTSLSFRQRDNIVRLYRYEKCVHESSFSQSFCFRWSTIYQKRLLFIRILISFVRSPEHLNNVSFVCDTSLSLFWQLLLFRWSIFCTSD